MLANRNLFTLQFLAASKTFITAAIPFIKFSSKEKIVDKALEVLELGADSIHCGSWNLNFMKYLNEFKIPFQGHAGLVPRLSTWIGGVKAYGKNSNEAMQLYKNIIDIEATGAWGIELECVPEDLIGELSKKTKMLTISIGSGKKADAFGYLVGGKTGTAEIISKSFLREILPCKDGEKVEIYLK